MERIVPETYTIIDLDDDDREELTFRHKVTDYSKTMDTIVRFCKKTGDFQPLMEEISKNRGCGHFLESTFVELIHVTRTHIIPNPAMQKRPEYLPCLLPFFDWYQNVFHDPAINTDHIMYDYMAAADGITDLKKKAEFHTYASRSFYNAFPVRNLATNELLELNSNDAFNPDERLSMFRTVSHKACEDLKHYFKNLSKTEIAQSKTQLRRTINGLLKLSAGELTKPKDFGHALLGAHGYASRFLGGYKSFRLLSRSWQILIKDKDERPSFYSDALLGSRPIQFLIKITPNKYLPHIFHHD